MMKSILSLLVLSAAVPFALAEPWTRHVIDDSSDGADGVRLADLDGDGHLDIATGWEEGGTTRIYLNPGPDKARQPWPRTTVGRTPGVEDAVFADLDGDGVPDVVTACEGGERSLNIHWAPSSSREDLLDPGKWSSHRIPAAHKLMQWMFAVPMQVDGARGPDLVAAGKNKDAAIGWFRAPENPRDLEAWTWHPLRPIGWVMSIAVTDMNGDGLEDISFVDRKGSRRGVYWLENPGTSPGAAWKEHLIGWKERTSEDGEALQLLFHQHHDLDGDGLVDVVAGVFRESEIAVFLRLDASGERWETRRIPVPEGFASAKSVRSADLDGDGKPELVVSCASAPPKTRGLYAVSDFLSDEKRTFHDLGGLEGRKFDLVEILDLDQDGHPDILTCEERDNLGVVWYENPGGPLPASGGE